MKRLLIICLAFSLCLSLSSCFLIPEIETRDFASFTAPEGAVHAGPLVVVNDETPYVAPMDQSNLVAVKDTWEKRTTAYRYDEELSLYMDHDALKALDMMLYDFYKLTEKDNVIISQTYVTPEELGELPADHLTGLGCVLKYVTAEETSVETDTEAETEAESETAETEQLHSLSEDAAYKWFFENCYKYGFVIRYPDGKESVTGVSDYTDYFRYVGAPHAEYMYERSLTLEEYVKEVQGYDMFAPISEYQDGVHYEIFYADLTAGNLVYYPAFHQFTYSGVGKDGIVVVLIG